MLKKLVYLISIGYTVGLTVVCLITLNDLPKVGVSFGDKIFHCLAYIVLSLLWYITFLYRFKINKQKALKYAVIFSIIFGIIIEILQGTLTTSRAFDVYDVLANTTGVFITVLAVTIKK